MVSGAAGCGYSPVTGEYQEGLNPFETAKSYSMNRLTTAIVYTAGIITSFYIAALLFKLIEYVGFIH